MSNVVNWESIGADNSEDKLEYVKFVEGAPVTLKFMAEMPHEAWNHWLNKAGRTVECKGKGQCVVCEAIEKAKEADLKVPASNSRRYSTHVIDIATGKLMILEQGVGFFKQVQQMATAMKSPEDKSITDVFKRMNLRVIRSGQKKDTTYTMIPLMSPDCVLTAEQEKEYNDNKVDLSTFKGQLEDIQILALMEGVPADEVFKKKDNDSKEDNSENIEV